MSEQESRLDSMLDALATAAVAGVFPLDQHSRRGLNQPPMKDRVHAAIRENLAAALRATVTDQGGGEVDGQRLDPEQCRADAATWVREALAGEDPQEVLTRTIADLLLAVREADQRERWIREGYSADARRAWSMMETAEQRAGELEHAVRLVKRATRDVRVGRE